MILSKSFEILSHLMLKKKRKEKKSLLRERNTMVYSEIGASEINQNVQLITQ